jgi:hypothetical protein
MLRTLVIALLLANAAFFAWTQGWLDAVVGSAAHAEREPQRLAQQVHPEAVRLLPAHVALAASAPPATRCLEAGPFDATEVVAAEAALAANPAASAIVGRWSRLSTDTPGVWMIAVGRAAPHDAQLKKITELKRLGVSFEVVKAASGTDETLSLGQFDALVAAQEALARLVARGIHTGRIVEVTPPATSHRLRVDAATPPEATALAPLVGWRDQAWRCERATARTARPSASNQPQPSAPPPWLSLDGWVVWASATAALASSMPAPHVEVVQ